MEANMRAKYIKYYGSFRELNPLVLIGLVLNPRFKLRRIVHLFNKEKFNEAEVQSKIKELKDMDFYENIEREHLSTASSSSKSKAKVAVAEDAEVIASEFESDDDDED
ncbi:hypothetical protein M0R45_031138 [Rubus argutus]|uniref:hAT-like transposase RNase-H fold domain-containing protein n=1 Tax=Rubus argutus TaxID=59490 RepID=A0AAW1WCQ3_RUBAR